MASWLDLLMGGQAPQFPQGQTPPSPSASDQSAPPMLNRVLGPAPPALRAYLSTILGNTSKIDESFFNPDELNILRNAAEKQLARGSNVIGYGDYGERDPWATGSQAVMNALTDPAHSLAFTLGMANVKRAPDGSIIINDKYDFAANKEKVAALKAQGIGAIMNKLGEGFVQNGLLGVGNVIGNLAVPQGSGRQVQIRIPPAQAPYFTGQQQQ